MILFQPDHIVSKKSFTLLVETRTIPFFAFVSIIYLKDCRLGFLRIGQNKVVIKDKTSLILSIPRYGRM